MYQLDSDRAGSGENVLLKVKLRVQDELNLKLLNIKFKKKNFLEKES